jgi:hypothetical protein
VEEKAKTLITIIANNVCYVGQGPFLYFVNLQQTDYNIFKAGYFTFYKLVVTIYKIQQFYVLPTQGIYVFCVNLRTNSDYFPIQH